MSHIISPDQICEYADWLIQEEHSVATVEKYLRNLRRFAAWLNDRPLCKSVVLAWRNHLQDSGYAPCSINGMIAALHSYFKFADITDCSVKYLRIQRTLFRDSDRALTQSDYRRLIRAAHADGKQDLALIMETICATGIRVSELRYITTDAIDKGRAAISLKGKQRIIFLPTKLRYKLQHYIHRKKITHGAIFCTVGGKPCTRYQIWAQMKRLSQQAGVAAEKIFPHNLRHLFAVSFYQKHRDIVRLADVLGHSSVETTRIYLAVSADECAQALDRLGLVI